MRWEKLFIVKCGSSGSLRKGIEQCSESTNLIIVIDEDFFASVRSKVEVERLGADTDVIEHD